MSEAIDFEVWKDSLKHLPDDTLPDGSRFPFWDPVAVLGYDCASYWSHTYHVACRDPAASDDNPGTVDLPWETISRAAQVLESGQRVLIGSGVYRETIRPQRGGSSAHAMIGYMAAPGATVVVSGSEIVPASAWRASEGWKRPAGKADYLPRLHAVSLSDALVASNGHSGDYQVYMLDVSRFLAAGSANPFASVNMLQDRTWLPYRYMQDISVFLKRRGMVFVDGKRLAQADLYRNLFDGQGGFWVEHHGSVIHLCLPSGKSLQDCSIELAVRETLFCPEHRGTGFVWIKGITFEKGANAFPVPQLGLVSTNRGHHFLMEDCIVQDANSVGIDAGNQCWHAQDEPGLGHHVFRRVSVRRAGVCALAAYQAESMLVESSVFEESLWQEADLSYESAGVKLHGAVGLLFRSNLVRHLAAGPALWLDCGNRNCRITGNWFADIATARGAVHVEATRFALPIEHLSCGPLPGGFPWIMCDRNLFARVRCRFLRDGTYGAGGCALYAEGSDGCVFAWNLVTDIEASGVYANAISDRMVAGRGGSCNGQVVLGNSFNRCGRAAIELEGFGHWIDENRYSRMPAGYLRIGTAAGQQNLDLGSWQAFHGFDRNGCMVDGDFPDFDDVAAVDAMETPVGCPRCLPDKIGRKEAVR